MVLTGSVAKSAGYLVSENPARMEGLLLGSINLERTQRGLQPLVGNDVYLSSLALYRSGDMAAHDYFSHTTPSGANFISMLHDRAIAYRWAGEILARNNYPLERSEGVAIIGFMASPEHRAIILDPRYTQVGVGYSLGSSGMNYYAAIFIEK